MFSVEMPVDLNNNFMREKMKQTIGTEDKENQKKGRSCSCGRSNIKKKKRNAYRQNEGNCKTVIYSLYIVLVRH